MENNNLEELFNIIIKNNGNDGLIDLLEGLKEMPDAFLYVFDKLSKEQIPDLNDEKNKWFKKNFFNVVCQLNDTKFNKYFFEYFTKTIPMEDIRREAANRTKNELLKDFINKVDVPKNIDSIMTLIKNYYGKDNDKMNNVIEQNYEKLKKLNTLISPKNKSLITLSYLLYTIYKDKNFEEVMNFCDKIGFDLVNNGKYVPSYAFYSGTVLRMNDELIYNYDNKKRNDLKQLDLLFLRNTEKPRYQVLMEITDLHDPIYLINELMKKNKEKAVYFWNIFKEYINDIPEKNIYYRNNIGGGKDNVFKILLYIYSNKKMVDNLGWRYSVRDINNNEINKFIDKFEVDISQCQFDLLDKKLIKKDVIKNKNKI